MAYQFRIEPSENPTPNTDRRAITSAPKFGQIFTDHMLLLSYNAHSGWHDGRIVARQPISLDPTSAVLHYAQEIFEGMKAYYQPSNGRTVLFRPKMNAERFNASARRMAMPEIPVDIFIDAVSAFVAHESDWVPEQIGHALYLRPFMIATEAFLGVRPAQEYLFLIVGTPAAGPQQNSPLRLAAYSDQVRAVQGGTGAAKCGGNYAAALSAQIEAKAAGCDQILFLDGTEHRWIEELSSMNIFFVKSDGVIVTPPLSGTILPGITRDSIIALAADNGMTVREEPYAIDQCLSDIASSAVTECFVCGTAAVIAPVAEIVFDGAPHTIGTPAPGPVTKSLKDRLIGIYHGTEPDSFDWVRPVS